MKSLSIATISVCFIAIGLLLAILGSINGQAGEGVAFFVVSGAVSMVLAKIAGQMYRKEMSCNCMTRA
jgi:hypothetical protein